MTAGPKSDVTNVLRQQKKRKKEKKLSLLYHEMIE